jgi:hypothetical protein
MIKTTIMNQNLTLEKAFKHANLLRVTNQIATMVVEASSTYIPIEEFKEIFNYIGDSLIENPITKLIFDKRKLSVFHQPSMEWYFVEWKEKMYDQGLRIHRKILPQNETFKQSVKIGREKILRDHPQGKFTLMDIQYAETIEEAIEK